MTYRRAGGLLAILLAADAACFDSDQTFKSLATTSTTGPGTTTTTTGTSTSTETTAVGTTGPYDSCRDAIDCVYTCAASIQAQLQANPDFEPDLSCFIECAETLSVDEVYKLFELITCTSEICKELGECEVPTDTGSSSGSGSSDTGSTGTSTTTSGGDAGSGGGLLDPCIQCIFIHVQDPESPGCEEFAMACE